MSLEIGQRGAPVITRQRTAPVALPPDGESPSSSTSLPLTSSAKPQRTGIAALTLGDIWDGIAGFFKRTFQLVRNFIGNRLAEPKPLDQENAAIAQAYCLLPSNENVQAFLDEVQSYEKQGAIGPGAPTDSVKSLQDSLKQLGYNILVNGNFDQATTSAVLDFKSRNGIHQNYVMADGKVAVNEYADSATLKLLQQKLVIEKPVTPQPVITPPVLTPPITASRPPLDQTLLRGNEAIIKQYNLFPSKENVEAFLAETQAYKTNGSLGPGMEAPADIKEMQTILSELGYKVKINCLYDEATTAAVVQFKKDSGLHEKYKLADGSTAVNEYATPETLAKLLERAEKKVDTPLTPVAPSAPSSGTYLVQNGDSLWKIAQARLGDGNRWHEIFDLNRDQISNPDLITAGMNLKMPGGSSQSSSAPAPTSSSQLSSLSSAELANLGANDKQAFFNALRPAAEEAEKQYGVPAALTLAQAALESGWGQHSIGGYNIFGIKGTGPAGTIAKQTQEWDGSKYITITANFARYNDFYEAVVEHGKLFHNGYYDKAINQFAQDHNYQNFVNNIQGIYATSPTYSKSIFSLIDQYGLA